MRSASFRILHRLIPGLACLAAIDPAMPAQVDVAASIPKTWNEADLVSQHLPLADSKVAVVPLPAERYYALPVRVLYKTYPIYHPDREPPGYLASLQQQEPQILTFDVARFKSEQEWLDYGRAVFTLPTSSDSELFGALITRDQLRDPQWYEKVPIRLDKKTGIMPYARYVVREKGKVEIGTLACAMCHTRVLDDGQVILGAQGNFPFDRNLAYLMRDALPTLGDEQSALNALRAFDVLLFGIPWQRSDPLEALAPVTVQKYIDLSHGIPPGVLARTVT
jgi:hypothetical protein